MRFLLFFVLIFSNLLATPVSPNEAFKIYPKVSQNSVIFNFDIDKSVFLYEKDLKFDIFENKTDITKFANFPNSQIHKNHQVFTGEFSVKIPLELVLISVNSQDFTLIANFNACSFDGFCYEPQTQIFKFIKNGSDYNINSLDKNILEQNSLSQEEKIASMFENKSFIITLLSFFGCGILLSLTPCVYPLIPILSSIIIAKTDKNPSVKKSFFISLIYVLAMSFAYACIGACVAIFGANFQSLLQNNIVITIFALIFVILALSMFGLFEIKMPQNLQNFINKKSGEKSGIIGVFIMGFFSVLIISPCISAPLSGALLYIASSGNVLYGTLALFMLGLGSGALLLIIGLGGGIPRPGAWMEMIKQLFGFLMLFMAVWILTRVVDENFALLLYGVLCVAFAVFFDFFTTKSKFKKTILLLILLYGISLIIGFNIGSKSILRPLENIVTTQNKIKIEENKAQIQLNFSYIESLEELQKFINLANKPIMVDFWASWCKNCEELEKTTFKNEKILEKLQNFELIKIDLTKSTFKNAKITEYFGVFGPPVLLFFKNGSEIKHLRVTGFKNKDEFLDILNEI